MLTLRPGKWTPIVLLAPATASGACGAAASVTVYPSEIALGAGRTITLAHPVAACGALRTLPYLPAGSASRTRSLAGRALKAAGASTATGITPAGDSPSGFWYGTDGPATMACGSAPYLGASSSSANPCASTDGQYGYMGEIGKWDVWQGCDSNGLAWNETDYNDANTNYDNYVDGVGASGYWMMAGPGRDPRYSGTTSEATTWGQDQAEEAAATRTAILYALSRISASRASRVRWWYQCERARGRRRPSSQWQRGRAGRMGAICWRA